MASDLDTVISDVGRQYLRFQLAADVGPIRFRKLLDHFGSIDNILTAARTQLEGVDGVGRTVAQAIVRARDDEAVDAEIDRAASRGVRILCMEDADYPKPLLNISDPPICLYVRGQLTPTDAVAVAIVGTRRCSHYGREQAVRFGESLGHAGFTVVSGLARGVDSHAHRGALQAGGRTIAVLGNGLASIYPSEHEDLANDICHAGAVVSETPIDTSPTRENFPRRNRIIAGLSLGVIIIEAGQRSGALITARLATEYNREVFALPGRVDHPQQTLGSNRLIRDSQAKLITCLDDVLDELAEAGEIMRRDTEAAGTDGFAEGGDAPPAHPTLVGDELAVWQTIANGVEDADMIHSSTALDVGRVTTALTALQLKGLVQRLPGNRFAPRRPQPAR